MVHHRVRSNNCFGLDDLRWAVNYFAGDFGWWRRGMSRLDISLSPWWPPIRLRFWDVGRRFWPVRLWCRFWSIMDRFGLINCRFRPVRRWSRLWSWFGLINSRFRSVGGRFRPVRRRCRLWSVMDRLWSWFRRIVNRLRGVCRSGSWCNGRRRLRVRIVVTGVRAGGCKGRPESPFVGDVVIGDDSAVRREVGIRAFDDAIGRAMLRLLS